MNPNLLCLNCMNEIGGEEQLCSLCGSSNEKVQNSPGQLSAGSILAGRYLVGKALGQGGFGVTYIAYNLNLEKKVAIKEFFPTGFAVRDSVTHSTVTSLPGDKGEFFKTGKTKFIEEAKSLAKFNNPNIVQVYDFISENGTTYIVMDFVEGKTLKEIALEAGGKLPSEKVFEYLIPVMEALSVVHMGGLLHRDISPDNIIITPEGKAVLLDFGAARQISAQGEHSNTINVKHGFAPEEQYRTHGEQGPWTDIYALCATIYKLITGAVPPQAMDRVLSGEELKKPKDLGADLTDSQQNAILKGLSVLGKDRQQSMQELLQDIGNKTFQYKEKKIAVLETKKTNTLKRLVSSLTDTIKTKLLNKNKKINWWIAGPIFGVALFLLVFFSGYAISKTAVSKGDFDTAKKALLLPKAVGLFDPAIESFINAGVLFEEGKTQKAEAELKNILKYDYSELYYDTILKWANLLQDMGENESAIKFYEEIKENLKNATEASYQLACCYKKTGDALKAYREFSNHPDYREAGLYLQNLKDELYSEAVKKYRRGETNGAKLYFKEIGSYGDSDKYLKLISIKNSNSFSKSDVDQLILMIGFEDAGELIFHNNEGGMYYFNGDTFKGNCGSIRIFEDKKGEWWGTWSIPTTPSGIWHFYNGYFFTSDIRRFSIKALSRNTVEITINKTGKTYTLTRQ